MKKTLIILSLLSGTVYAQCPVIPACTNTVQVSNLWNQSTNQSTCFVGNGYIPSNYNWNNWSYLSFNGEINIYQNVNFPGGAKKVYNQGFVTYYGHVNWNGQDTMVLSNATVTLTEVTANNTGNNAIVLGINSYLFLDDGCGGYDQYFVGDTIHTTSSNYTNNVYVLGCSSTPLGIKEFNLRGNVLYWKATGNSEIQYSSDSKNFQSIYFTSQQEGKLTVHESGYYRLYNEGTYSKMVRFNLTSTIQNNNVIYYHEGKFQFTRPNAPVVGTKQLK